MITTTTTTTYYYSSSSSINNNNIKIIIQRWTNIPLRGSAARINEI
jgi:hypothetical protein